MRINAYLMALYIFQFGLMQPLASIVNSQIPISAFTALLSILLLVNNGLKLKKYVLRAFFIITFYFFINFLFVSDLNVVFMSYLEFIAKGFSAFIFGSLEVDENDLYKAFERIGIINALTLIFYPFTDSLSSLNYMRFGYAIAPSALVFWLRALNEKKQRFTWISISIIVSAITITYGSRGTIIVFSIFFVSYFGLLTLMNTYKKILLSIFFGTLSWFTIRFEWSLKILEFIFYDLEIKTYTIRKLLGTLNRGLAETSSGRDVIYDVLLDYFKLNPIYGNGVSFSMRISRTTAHNIFIQILVESGVLGMLFWIVFWIYLANIFLKIRKAQTNNIVSIIIVLFSISFGRLLVSSDMWLRPEYWFLISLIINYRFKKEVTGNNY